MKGSERQEKERLKITTNSRNDRWVCGRQEKKKRCTPAKRKKRKKNLSSPCHFLWSRPSVITFFTFSTASSSPLVVGATRPLSSPWSPGCLWGERLTLLSTDRSRRRAVLAHRGAEKLRGANGGGEKRALRSFIPQLGRNCYIECRGEARRGGFAWRWTNFKRPHACRGMTRSILLKTVGVGGGGRRGDGGRFSEGVHLRRPPWRSHPSRVGVAAVMKCRLIQVRLPDNCVHCGNRELSSYSLSHTDINTHFYWTKGAPQSRECISFFHFFLCIRINLCIIPCFTIEQSCGSRCNQYSVTSPYFVPAWRQQTQTQRSCDKVIESTDILVH